MTTIVTRTNKTTELLYAEGDANLNLDVIAAASDPSIGLAANRSTYECTSTFNFTLPLASTMISPTPGSTAKCNDYRVTIKNAGSGTITVKTTSTDTLDGVAATGDQAILPNEAFEYQVNVGKDGWLSISKVSANAVSAAAVITDNRLIKGDGGARGAQETGITVADTSNNTSGVGTLGCGNITSSGTIGGTTITASASFSGAGTNLTGTAASLTAGNATLAAGLSATLVVGSGGTGATTLADGGVLIGKGTGAIETTGELADGEMIVGDGTTNPAVESGATLRTSIGVGTSNSPQFAGVNVGHASDTTITRTAAGVIAVEGAVVPTIASSTWTPVLSDASANAATMSVQIGQYYKIGNLCYVYGKITITSKASMSGALLIKGLPFTAANNSVDAGVLTPSTYSNLTGFSGATIVNSKITANSTQSSLTRSSNNALSVAISDANILDTFTITFSGTYETA